MMHLYDVLVQSTVGALEGAAGKCWSWLASVILSRDVEKRDEMVTVSGRC